MPYAGYDLVFVGNSQTLHPFMQFLHCLLQPILITNSYANGHAPTNSVGFAPGTSVLSWSTQVGACPGHSVAALARSAKAAIKTNKIFLMHSLFLKSQSNRRLLGKTVNRAAGS
jgi:hypothetical protein